MIELLEEAGENIAAVIVLIVGFASVFVEVSKIKLNPWTKLLKWIGNALNGDVKKELSNINGTLKSHSDSLRDIEMLVDMNEIKRIRAEIFAFADSCKLGEKHTEDGFLHIIDIHDDYEALLEKYQMTNGRISVDYEYIMSVYRELRAKGTFSERTV